MAIETPNDRTLLNVVSHFEREIPGRQLTVAQINSVTEAAKRLIIDEIHSMKARRG